MIMKMDTNKTLVPKRYAHVFDCADGTLVLYKNLDGSARWFSLTEMHENRIEYKFMVEVGSMTMDELRTLTAIIGPKMLLNVIRMVSPHMQMFDNKQIDMYMILALSTQLNMMKDLPGSTIMSIALFESFFKIATRLRNVSMGGTVKMNPELTE